MKPSTKRMASAVSSSGCGKRCLTANASSAYRACLYPLFAYWRLACGDADHAPAARPAEGTLIRGLYPYLSGQRRVEADTSVLWTWLLALLTWASRLDLDTVIVGSGLVLAPLGLLLALLGARELHRGHSPDQVLLPVPVPKLRAGLTGASLFLLAATIGVWALGAGLRWRDPTPPGIIPESGIAAERGYWTVYANQQHPDNAAEYVLAGLGSADATGSLEWLITKDARSGQAVLLYYPGTTSGYVSVPLNRPRYSVAIAFSLLGQGGAGTPLDGLVVDQHGLSYALGSHLVGDPNGRPGHTKWVIPAWIVAEYSNVAQAPGIPAAQLAAARKALSCGKLAELDQAVKAPLTVSRFAMNFFHSPALTTFRFSPDPVTAEQELCH
jgi:hypothetical protein